MKELLGLQVYLSRYNAVEPNQQVKLTDHESFEDWHVTLPELDDGVLLCCPEDFAAVPVMLLCLLGCSVHVFGTAVLHA